MHPQLPGKPCRVTQPRHALRLVSSVNYALISEADEAHITFDWFTLTLKAVYRCVLVTIANGNTAGALNDIKLLCTKSLRASASERPIPIAWYIDAPTCAKRALHSGMTSGSDHEYSGGSCVGETSIFCRSLGVTYAPVPDDVAIMIVHSGVTRALRLGHDTDDPIIHRCLRAKMEFLKIVEIQKMEPSEAASQRFFTGKKCAIPKNSLSVLTRSFWAKMKVEPSDRWRPWPPSGRKPTYAYGQFFSVTSGTFLRALFCLPCHRPAF
jgi:hypothetical protein